MRDAMHSRGPDGAGLWLSEDSTIGLAHRRLAIIDLSEAAAQPMASVDGNLRITYNGEIYNFRELRRELENAGVQFRTTSDTEVLLELYRVDGPGLLSKLRGMYAFAIWDAPKRTLFLARDPFGIKPLYFADDGKTVRFASQVKALLAGGQIDTSLSPAGQVGYFLWGHVPEPYTIYRAIRSLPPGHALLVRSGERPKIWKDRDALDVLTSALSSDSLVGVSDQPSPSIESAVSESVGYHLVADVPVGCFLSSGIDSNVLCAVASQMVTKGSLECVTLGFDEFDGTGADEVPLARESAASLDVRHQVRYIAQDEFFGDIERLLQSMDQPTVDGVNTYFVAKAAAASGLKVAISGVGADELFGGYPSFSQVPRLASLSRWLPQSPSFGAYIRRLTAPIVSRFASPKYASLVEYGGTLSDAYFLRRSLFLPWEAQQLLDRDIFNQGIEELSPRSTLRDRLSHFSSPHVVVMAAEITEYLQPRLLRDTDWAGMAHSVEIRTPFVDIRFFDQIAKLVANPCTIPTKRALAGVSPVPLVRSVVERPKSGFGVPIESWLLGEASHSRAAGLRSWAITLANRFGLVLSDEAQRSIKANNGPTASLNIR